MVDDLTRIQDFKPVDPLEFASVVWPDVRFYSKQKEIIYSVENNDETIVYAGNGMGKDFVAGFITLSYFLRYPVVRIITTSIRDDHLRVLWGEIDRYIQTAKYPLLYSRNNPGSGPLIYKHRELKKIRAGHACPISYVRGMVSEKPEGLAGHHASYTLAIFDEASGIDDMVYSQVQTWAKRILIIGNPHATTNFFYRAYKEGERLAV